MNPHFPLALLLATAAASHPTGAANLPPEVSEVLSRALAVPGARIVPLGWAPQLPAGCVLPRRCWTARSADRAACRSNCTGKGVWVGVGTLRVWAPAAFTTRPVRAGEPLQAALTVEDREIRSGHAAYVPPPGALAARDLPRGTVLQAAHVAGATLASGESVKVMVMSGRWPSSTRARDFLRRGPTLRRAAFGPPRGGPPARGTAAGGCAMRSASLHTTRVILCTLVFAPLALACTQAHISGVHAQATRIQAPVESKGDETAASPRQPVARRPVGLAALPDARALRVNDLVVVRLPNKPMPSTPPTPTPVGPAAALPRSMPSWACSNTYRNWTPISTSAAVRRPACRARVIPRAPNR